MVSTRRWCFDNIYFDIVILCVIAALFVTILDVREGAAIGWVDSAIYHSLFLEKESVIQRSGATYFASRWPWILLGTAVFNFFPAQYASSIFTILILSFISICTYFLARRFFSTSIALALAAISSCNMQVAATVSAAYPSAFASGFLLLGAATALHAYRTDSATAMFGAGLLYGLGVVTQPFSIVVGVTLHLCIVITYLPSIRWPRDVRFFGSLVAGGLAVLPLSYLAFLSYALSPEVVNHIIATARRSLTGGQGLAFHKPFPFIFGETGSYLFFLCGVLSTLYSLKSVNWRWYSLSQNTRLLHTMFLALLLVFIVWDIWFSAVTLQYSFYNVFLYGVTALQLGVFLYGLGDIYTKSKVASVLLAASVIVVLLLVVWAVNMLSSGVLPVTFILAGVIMLSFVATVFGNKPPKYGQRKVRSRITPVVILFVSCAIASSITRYGLSARDPSGVGNEGTAVINWALNLTSEYATQTTQPLLFAYNRGDYELGPEYPLRNDRWEFFYSGNRYFFNVFDTVAAVSGWGDGMITTDFIQFDFSRAIHYLTYAPAVSLLVLSNESNIRRRVGEVRERAEMAGFQVGPGSAGTYNGDTVKFSWSVLSLSRERD